MLLIQMSCISISQPSTKHDAIIGSAHSSIYIYNLNGIILKLESEFMLEPVLKESPTFIKLPYDNRRLEIYGDNLTIEITQSANKGYNIFNREKRVSFTGFVSDTTKNEQIPSSIKDIEFQIKINNQIVKNWIEINKNDEVSDSFFNTNNKNIYSLFKESVQENSLYEITLRNKNRSNDLIKFILTKKPQNVVPFVAATRQEIDPNKTLANFIEEVLTQNQQLHELENLMQFYKYWPSKYGYRVENEEVSENTKIALFFRKPNSTFVDTSLEYKIINDGILDSAWKTTGHILFVSNFKSGNQYRLLVRYKSFPTNIWQTSYFVAPKWYQTLAFKIIVVSLSSLILAIFGLLLFRRRAKNQEKKTKLISMKLKSIRLQLNPHFIFNSLNSIQGLINKNEINEANIYLTEFSNLLRETLKNNEYEYTPLSEELKNLESYIKLEQLRFKFSYNIFISDYLNTDNIELPSLFLQPFIENAIKHGISGLQEKGILNISISQSANNLLIDILDNGKGFNFDLKTNGFGLKLTKERIALLNKSLNRQHIKLLFKKNDFNGTTVNLIFEKWM